ncbi:MAG: gliding motility-associated protein GldE, partial [Crocinitomix sp.]|nr:gliding motility-associated protein GldE [Crocinitomix sp.]
METLNLTNLAVIQWNEIWMSVTISGLVIVLLLIGSALMSGSEVAFFSLTPSEIETISEDSSKSSQTVIDLLKKPKGLLATLLIANNFINVAIILVASNLSNQLLIGRSDLVKFIINVILITFIILLFGEVIPKIYSSKNRKKVAVLMAIPVSIISRTPPFSFMRQGLVRGTDFINSKVKKRVKELSADDLSDAIELTSKGHDDKRDLEIYQGIIEFGKKDVKQIMKPRLDVEAFEIGLIYTDILKLLNENGSKVRYSRIPVYRATFDKIEGILFVKDLLPYLDEQADFNWQKLIREPYFVPENKKIDDLLKSFQERKMHMAVVVDEYGGTSGIVTLDDVLVEIVGDISLDHSTEELVY